VAAPHTYRQVDEFVATEGQTTFNVRFYDIGYLDVYVNGVQLGNSDYQASDGATVIIQVPLRKGDLVRIISAYNTVLTISTINATPDVVLLGNGLNSFKEVLPATGTVLTSDGTTWFASNTVTGNVTIDGSLTVTGNTTTVTVNDISLANGLIYLAPDNPTDAIDLGIVGSFTSGTYQHTGIVRDATDGVWKLFSNVASEPGATVDFTYANYDTLKVGAVISNGVNVNSYLQSSYDQANTATNNAASASLYANTGINNAASASLYANTGINDAVSASLYANTGINNAASASLYANSGITVAQAAFEAANAAANLVPQNAQSTTYALVGSDAGKHIYFTNSSAASLFIPNNGQVNWTVGTTIALISRTSSSANVTITPNTGVSMFLAANTTSSSRVLVTYGMATIINTGANTWFINGTGVI
jgi:hypothetical protein